MSDKKFYVYVHRYASGPKEGQVFYVGKGNGNRYKAKRGRNPYWKNVVNKYGFYSEIVMRFKRESCSFSFEIALIKFYGRENLVNLTDGGEGVSGIEFPNEEIQRRREFATGRKMSEYTKKLLSVSRIGIPRECISGPRHPSYDDNIYEFTHESGDFFVGTSYEFHKKYNLPNSSVRKLVRDGFRSYKGWMIKGREAKELGRRESKHHFWGVTGPCNPVCKKDVFYFKNVNGDVFKGTRSEFYTKYGLNRSSVSALVNGRVKTYKGWTARDL